MNDFEPVMTITYHVSAYDESGYGDDRSRDFSDGAEAVAYAETLEKRFSPIVVKTISMQPIRIRIFP